MRWLIACLLMLTSHFVVADGPVYAELQLGAGGVSHSDLDFYPAFGAVNVGAYVFRNIGLELFADSSIAEGDDGNFELEIEQAYGVALRFQSPPVQGLQGYIVLGMVNYTIDQRVLNEDGVSSPAGAVNEEFTGVRASVGVMQRLKRAPGLQFTAEYRHYNADEPLRLDALVFGLRFNAP